MGDMDQGIKRLLQMRPQEILALVFPDANPEYLGPIEIDVAMEPQLITDVLYRARLYGEECAVDFEAEAYPSADMARRCFKYGSRIDIIQDLPVLSVVLYLQPGGAVPTAPYRRSIGPIEVATWNFFNVEVYRLLGRDILNAGWIGLMPLVPFMADRSLEIFEEAVQTIQANVPNQQQATDLESLLAVFGARFFGPESIMPIIRSYAMSFEILSESPLFREWWDKAEARGEAKGIAEGKAEGKLEGTRAVVRLILEGRFGALAADMNDAIEQADSAQLEDVARHGATETLEQLRARLQPSQP